MEEIRFNLPTNEVVEGEVLNEIFRKIDDNFKIKMEFVCTTTQLLTDNPTINVLKNDYGVEVIATRVDVGDYTYTINKPLLVIDKTVPVKELLVDEFGNKITLELINTYTYSIKTVNSDDEPADGILTNQYLSFETYR